MKKKLSYLLLLICLFGISGCFKKNEPLNETEPVEIKLFYLDTCGSCRSLKNILIPKIESELKGKVTITLIDVDQDEGKKEYDQIVGYYDQEHQIIEGKLEGFPPDLLNQYYVPLVVVDGYYAFLGYEANGYDQDYINDIKNALNQQPLNPLMDDYRWRFK